MIGGRSFTVVRPSLSDSRLHLAVVVISIQILGQTSLGFPLSIAQILISIGTGALADLLVTAVGKGVIAWPASGMLTGNSVALILRVQGTEHGDWWSTRGWYYFAGTALVAMLTKYLIRTERGHVFNPANVALVAVFVVVGPAFVEPQDLWWGPLTPGLILTIAIIAAGSLAVSFRIGMAPMSLGFWATFALGTGALALTGQYMSARWNLGPVDGFDYWWILVTSPEVLIFQFFMITDPRTSPASSRFRWVQGVVIGAVATLMIAPQTTEYATKVALLASLTVVCLMRPLAIRLAATRRLASNGTAIGALALVTISFSVAIGAASHEPLPEPPGGVDRSMPLPDLPAVEITPAIERISSPIDQDMADAMARELAADMEIERRAIESGEAATLEGSSTGRRLDELRKALEDGSATALSYEIDSLRLILMPPATPQSPPELGFAVAGRATSAGGAFSEIDDVFVMKNIGTTWLISDVVTDPDSGEQAGRQNGG